MLSGGTNDSTNGNGQGGIKKPVFQMKTNGIFPFVKIRMVFPRNLSKHTSMHASIFTIIKELLA